MVDDDPAERLDEDDARPFRKETLRHYLLRSFWGRSFIVVVALWAIAVIGRSYYQVDTSSIGPIRTAKVMDKTYATFTAEELKAVRPVCRKALRALPLQQTLLYVQVLNDAHANDDKSEIKYALDHLADQRRGAMAAWQPGQPVRLCSEGQDLKRGELLTVAESTIGEAAAAIWTLGAGRDGNGVSAYYQHGDALNTFVTQVGKVRDLKDAFFPPREIVINLDPTRLARPAAEPRDS